MTITQPFEDAVLSKDTFMTRIMLKNSLNTDLTFQQFKEMLAYTLKTMPQIIDEHDGKVFESKSNWTKEYAVLLKEELLENFSAERIEHAKEVYQYVFATELNQQKIRSAASDAEVSLKKEQTDLNMKTLITVLGVTIASILFGVILNLSITQIVVSTVVASCVVGGITYYLVKK